MNTYIIRPLKTCDRNYETKKKVFKTDPQGAPGNAEQKARKFAAKLDKDESIRRTTVKAVKQVDESTKVTERLGSANFIADINRRIGKLQTLPVEELAAIYQRYHKIVCNTGGVPKRELISDILRDEFGDPKVDEWMIQNKASKRAGKVKESVSKKKN